MTTFAITGLRGGKRVTVSWTDGTLTGDAETIAWLKRLAAMFEGKMQGQPGGPYTYTDHLASPYTARVMMLSVFERGTTSQSGHLPLLDIPDGAIH